MHLQKYYWIDGNELAYKHEKNVSLSYSLFTIWWNNVFDSRDESGGQIAQDERFLMNSQLKAVANIFRVVVCLNESIAYWYLLFVFKQISSVSVE